MGGILPGAMDAPDKTTDPLPYASVKTQNKLQNTTGKILPCLQAWFQKRAKHQHTGPGKNEPFFLNGET